MKMRLFCSTGVSPVLSKWTRPRRPCYLQRTPRMRAGSGLVMVAVLVILALTAMVAAGLLFRMTAEVSASAAQSGGERAEAAAMSGLQRAMAILRDYGSDPTVWTDNPELFQNQLVCDDGSTKWYFSIYAPKEGDVADIRYGLEEDSGKINVNLAPPQLLLALPGMTPELVDCLIDYRDEDSKTSPSGAEQDYYDQLSQPYVIANGPLQSLEELLMVKDFTAQIVYGEDANLSGVLDANENDGDKSFPPDDSDGQLDMGLRGVLTVYGGVPPRQESRSQVDMNDPKAIAGLELPEQTIKFMQTYLADGNKFAHPSQLLEMQYTPKKKDQGSQKAGKQRKGRRGQRGNQTDGPPTADTQPTDEQEQAEAEPAEDQGQADQMDTPDQTDEQDAEGGEPIESGVGAEQLPYVIEHLRGPLRPAMTINVNAAPQAVLSVLPGMTGDAARSVVQTRATLDAETLGNYAWLYTQGAVDAETFKKIAPALTTRSYQFHVRCIGFGSPGGSYRVLEAVIDVSRATPRIVYLRDLTRLGLPLPVDAEKQELQ